MAKWSSAAFLDGGLDYLAANATKLLLVDAYAAGDSYATVIGNKVAEVTMAPGDYAKSSSGNNRVITTAAGKSANATASTIGGDNLHLVFTDGAANVIYATDETSDQVITSGNLVNFPQLTYTSNQPT